MEKIAATTRDNFCNGIAKRSHNTSAARGFQTREARCASNAYEQGGFLMKGKYLRKFGSIILAALLLPAAATLLSSTSAQAQRRVVIVRTYRPLYRPWGWGYRRSGYDPYFDYYSRYGHYVFKSSESAYSEGYHDGLKTGQGDAKHRRSYDPQRSHYFQEAGFGNFGEVYRSGFVRGYADGFRS